MMKNQPWMIAWNPSDYIGFSNEEIELIKRGFNHALNQVYSQCNEKPFVEHVCTGEPHE